MELARVLGSVTATAKTESLRSHKLLVIRPLDASGSESGTAAVAVDTVGAGPGDQVLVVRGSAARQPADARAAATDLTIVAIVDSVDLPGGGATSREPTKTRSN